MAKCGESYLYTWGHLILEKEKTKQKKRLLTFGKTFMQIKTKLF
jgi:hypothetical protein